MTDARFEELLEAFADDVYGQGYTTGRRAAKDAIVQAINDAKTARAALVAYHDERTAQFDAHRGECIASADCEKCKVETLADSALSDCRDFALNGTASLERCERHDRFLLDKCRNCARERAPW